MHLLADDTQIYDRPGAFVFSSALKRRESFVSCGLAPVLIWTNDFFGAGSHLELRQSPWPPLIPNKRRRHNVGGGSKIWSDSGKVEDSQRLGGEELHKGASGTNLGVCLCLHGERARLFGENNLFFFFFVKGSRLGVVTPEG